MRVQDNCLMNDSEDIHQYYEKCVGIREDIKIELPSLDLKYRNFSNGLFKRKIFNEVIDCKVFKRNIPNHLLRVEQCLTYIIIIFHGKINEPNNTEDSYIYYEYHDNIHNDIKKQILPRYHEEYLPIHEAKEIYNVAKDIFNLHLKLIQLEENRNLKSLDDSLKKTFIKYEKDINSINYLLNVELARDISKETRIDDYEQNQGRLKFKRDSIHDISKTITNNLLQIEELLKKSKEIKVKFDGLPINRLFIKPKWNFLNKNIKQLIENEYEKILKSLILIDEAQSSEAGFYSKNFIEKLKTNLKYYESFHKIYSELYKPIFSNQGIGRSEISQKATELKKLIDSKKK